MGGEQLDRVPDLGRPIRGDGFKGQDMPPLAGSKGGVQSNPSHRLLFSPQVAGVGYISCIVLYTT